MKTGEQFKEWRASYRDYVMGPYGRPEDSLLAEMFANARKPLEEEIAKSIDPLPILAENARLKEEVIQLMGERDKARRAREEYWRDWKASEGVVADFRADISRLTEEVEELKKSTVTCDYCGFRYGAEHTNADGSGYSCPQCEASTLAAEVERPKALNITIDGAIMNGDLNLAASLIMRDKELAILTAENKRLTAEGKRLTKERDHARETRENYWNAFKKSEDDAIRLAAENKHLREAMMTKQYVSIVKVGDHCGLRFGDGAPFVPVVGSKIELPVVLPKGEVIIG